MARYTGAPERRIVDRNNDPVAQGQLEIRAAGTTTRAVVYSDQAMTTPLPNPVIADGDGYLPEMYVVISKYDELHKSAGGVIFRTAENIEVMEFDEVTEITVDLVETQGKVAALESNRVLRSGDTMTGTLRVTRNSDDALVNLEGNRDTSMKLVSRQDGATRNNAGIVFDTPRSDTTNGQTSVGRAVIKSMGNSVDNTPRLMIATRTSGANVSDGVSDTRNYNGSAIDIDDTRIEFFGNGNVRGTLIADFNGTPTLGSQLITRAMGDNRYALSASDENLKLNIRDMPDGALETIKALTPRLFEFIASENRPGTHCGLISQEVAQHIPSAIVGQEGRRGIDALTMIGILVKGIQGLAASDQASKDKIQALEGEIALLKGAS